ncbi:MAG: hypothetical protein U5K31_12785 [Balneolaceae bacterium]|nr:hypothetical protein [Balneolaceae bacterium]
MVAGLQEARAQQSSEDRQIAIPLSNPGQPGSLELGVVRGSITVTGYDGDEVLINYGGEDASSGQQEVTRQGLRRRSGSGIGFEVTEDDNEVHVGGVSPMRSVDFRVSVPRNFALHLSTANGGKSAWKTSAARWRSAMSTGKSPWSTWAAPWWPTRSTATSAPPSAAWPKASPCLLPT